MATSPQFQFNKHDMGRVGEIFVQAIISILIVQAIQIVPQVNFGPYAPIVMTLLLPLLEAAKRYFQTPTDATTATVVGVK